MLFTHPDRKHKPLRPRAGRADHRDPDGAGVGNATGSGNSGAAGGCGIAPPGYFYVGGNAFFPGGGGGAGTSGSCYRGGHVLADTNRAGVHDAVGPGRGGGRSGAGEEDVTLLDPGKVCVVVESSRSKRLREVVAVAWNEGTSSTARTDVPQDPPAPPSTCLPLPTRHASGFAGVSLAALAAAASLRARERNFRVCVASSGDVGTVHVSTSS